MNIWQMFGWRRKRAATIVEMLESSAGVESATIENTAWSPKLGDATEAANEALRYEIDRLREHVRDVTPRRLPDVPSPIVGDDKRVDVKCAWCNAPSSERVPTGAWPSIYKCPECGKQSEVLSGTFITRIVPSDSVTRQIARGEMQ